MQVAIFDHCLNQITIFDIPKEIEQEVENDDMLLSEYIENLPGFDITWCTWMSSAEPIIIRVGKQSDFPEFNGKIAEPNP